MSASEGWQQAWRWVLRTKKRRSNPLVCHHDAGSARVAHMAAGTGLHHSCAGERRKLVDFLKNELERDLQITLVCARKHHPKKGDKTDFRDAIDLALHHRHGLLNRSFLPARGIVELRDLTRRRMKLLGHLDRASLPQQRKPALPVTRRGLKARNARQGEVCCAPTARRIVPAVFVIVRRTCFAGVELPVNPVNEAKYRKIGKIFMINSRQFF